MTEDPSFHADAAPETAARDLALMERVKCGDEAAFRELIEAHQHRVVGTISKLLGADLDAEDLAQQVFIRVWRSAPRYEPTAKFTTWLYTITRNLVFNEVRRRKRRPVHSSSQSAGEDGEMPLEDHSAKGPDDAILDAEMQSAIQRAIEELPEVQRMAIVLRRYDDVSYEEIGTILNLTVPAVKSTLFRARTELREKLKKYLEG